MRGRKILERVPFAREAIRTIDDLRRERDGLRCERDGLRRERDGLRRERDGLRRERDRLRRRLSEAAAEAERLQSDVNGTAEKPSPLLFEPSFLARTEALRRVRKHSQELHGHRDPVWAFNSKLAGMALAAELGLAVPLTLAEPTSLSELTLPSQRCVVKPVNGAGGHGVAPLVPVEDGRWRDLYELDKGHRSWEDIRADLAGLVSARRVSQEFFVEELLPGPDETSLPYDWKLFCVGGEVAAIFGRDTRNQRFASGATFRYFSADWEDLGPIGNPAKIDPTIPIPHHPDELLRAAAAVAAALPTLFVRVDLYDTPDRVVFGELTPQPGEPPWFGPELDRSIGELWDRAEARTWQR